MRRYGELYSLIRLETLDSLDTLPELVNSEELKNKLLFSVVVVSSEIEKDGKCHFLTRLVQSLFYLRHNQQVKMR